MNRRSILKSIGAGGLFALGVTGSAGARNANAGGSSPRVKLSDGRVLEVESTSDCDCIIDDCSAGCPHCCDVCIC